MSEELKQTSSTVNPQLSLPLSTASAGANNNDALLSLLLGNITDKARALADEELDKVRAEFAHTVKELQKSLRESKKKIETSLGKLPPVVNVGTIEKPVLEVTHKSFDRIIKVLSSSRRKEKNIMLVGGAGGGKTHLCGQIAKALQRPFYPMSVGLQTTKSDLLGFINATGQYVSTCIRQAYEHGGLLLLDEFDAAHAGVVTILNSLLANGHCSFPDKVVEKHPDFVCLCACNTYGKGGTIDYVGRNRLDAATLDRFIIIDVDYDETLEGTLTNHKEWSKVIKNVRKEIAKQGIKMIVSPRASMDGADLLDAGFTMEEVLEMTIFKGCDEDVRTKLKRCLPSSKTETETETTKSSGCEENRVKTEEEILKGVDIHIIADFRDFTYKVYGGSEKLNTLGGFDFKVDDDKKVCVSPRKNDYTPYIDNDRLWMNNEDVWSKFKEDSCVSGAPEEFIELLKTAPCLSVCNYNIALEIRVKGHSKGHTFIRRLTNSKWYSSIKE